MHASSSGSSASAKSSSPQSSATDSTASTASFGASTMRTEGALVSNDDSSKLKTFLGILKKFIGVSDIATVRFSLPAQLLEPQPNLEYWNYLDRPETFVSIGDSDDPLERTLAVLRFWFTKDLKYVKGKPCKPYNSVLGEFFRCNWEVEDNLSPALGRPTTNKANNEPTKPVRVSYLTEQTSHHPPVSAFYVDCPEKGISARGFDQISAKFTGTSIRVTPGAHNLGIFITLHARGNEQYQLTHPAAYLGGLLRGITASVHLVKIDSTNSKLGTLSVTVSDICYISCPKTRTKVILHYLEEGWLGKTQHRVDGVVFKYDPENDNKSKIKDVPEADILARIEGSWMEKIFVTLPNSTDKMLLVDLNPLLPVAKIVPSEEDQLPNESRKFWSEVTQAIHAREFSKATQLKHEIEEKQRQKAAARISRSEEWKPRFFIGAVTPVGRPSLTKDGEEALRGLHEGRYSLQLSNDV